MNRLQTKLLPRACALALAPLVGCNSSTGNNGGNGSATKPPAVTSPDHANPQPVTEAGATPVARAVADLLPALGGSDLAAQESAQNKLDRMAMAASRPGAEAERAALCAAMAGQLRSDVPATARYWLIRELERCGRGESVAALASQASGDSDAVVRAAALRALSANPSPEAAEALRGMLGDHAGPAGSGGEAAIHKLAYRRDARDAAAFARLAASEDDAVRTAAVLALARVGDASNADVILTATRAGAAPARQAAADALFVLASRVAANDKAAAAGIYHKALMTLGSQPRYKAAAIAGLGMTAGDGEVNTYLDALGDGDAAVVGAAVDALEPIKSADVTRLLIDRSAALPPVAKALVLAALGRRGDKAALPVLLEAVHFGGASTRPTTSPLTDPVAGVRICACRALGDLGDASAVPVLLEVAAATKGEEQHAARDGVEAMRGDAADAAVLARTTAGATNPPAVRAEAVRMIGVRVVKGALPTVLKLAAADMETGVRNEAYAALSILGGPGDLPAAVKLLVGAQSDGDREQASKAVAAISKRVPDPSRRAEPVLAAMTDAKGDARLALIATLARVGGEAPLAAVRGMLADPDPATRDAAARALGDWVDGGSMPDLLAIASGQVGGLEAKQQVLALRGYVRLIPIATEGKPGKERLELVRRIWPLAKRPEEQRLVLGAAGDVRDARVMELLLTAMDIPAVAEDAANAAVKVAHYLREDQTPSYKSAMEKVLVVSKKDDVKKQARDALDQIAEKAKEAKAGGAV